MKAVALLATVVALVEAISLSPRDTVADPPNFGYDELWELQNAFYRRFLYPANVKEAESINSTAFAEDVQGRVSDTRNFDGRELNTEYIFGLFTPSDALSIIGRPIGPFEILQFAANQNIASATTRIQFSFPSFKNMSLPITIDTWMTWNSAKEITQYDVTFRWFGNLLQKLLTSVDKNATQAIATSKDMIAKSICSSHSKYCNGTNTQYSSTDDCYHFLTQEIRMGESFELGMDTLLCRNIHEIMLKFRPDVHCPHIGKTGGGQCDDRDTTYEQKVEQRYFTNSPWIPTKLD